MKLTWLGHACFLLEEDGYRIVLDPYTGVAGYPPLHIQAHAVFCSHGHFDHHATDCVELLPERESPFTVREVETFHDDRGGALRGTNTVRVFTAGGLSAVHLGDLGHQLTVEQAAAIGPVDAVLVPVGGVYTVDAAGAKAVCAALHPRCVVPMHYHHALGYVVDMLHFQFWPSYPTFNVADVCIVSGAILGAIYYVLIYEKHDRRKTDGASDPANGQ